MNNYEIKYHTDGKWHGYTVFRNGRPVMSDLLRTRAAAVRQAQIEIQKLQRADSQPLAA